MVRIIEILNDNNVWQALVLPNGPDGKNSLVVSHNDCSDWRRNIPGTYGSMASAISIDDLSAATKAYVLSEGIKEAYCVSLKTMCLVIENWIERDYNNLSDSFYGKNLTYILKVIAGEKFPECLGVEDMHNPRMVFDDYIEDFREQLYELSRVETLAEYVAGVTNRDRIRVIFF